MLASAASHSFKKHSESFVPNTHTETFLPTMHTSQVLAALALAAPLVSSSPVDLQPRKQSFRVNQVSSGKKFTKNGPAAYARALGKYHAPVPSHVQEAAASQSGSAAANPVGDDLEYVTPVTIGSQTLNLDFDTGSSDL